MLHGAGIVTYIYPNKRPSHVALLGMNFRCKEHQRTILHGGLLPATCNWRAPHGQCFTFQILSYRLCRDKKVWKISLHENLAVVIYSQGNVDLLQAITLAYNLGYSLIIIPHTHGMEQEKQPIPTYRKMQPQLF